MDINEDMIKLEGIMNVFELYPVIKEPSDKANPIDRLIFCNILADKYSELRDIGVYGHYSTSPRTPVSKYLGYSTNNSIKYQLREGAVKSIKGYKEYENKYKVIKAAFNDDVRYIEITKYQEIRDTAQANMTSLMTDMLND